MQGAAVARWTGFVPGREKQFRQWVRDTNALCDRLVTEGRITDYAWYGSMHGNDGFLVTRGELEQLAAIGASQESLALDTRGALITTDYFSGFYATGDSLEAGFDLFEQTVAQLG